MVEGIITVVFLILLSLFMYSFIKVKLEQKKLNIDNCNEFKKKFNMVQKATGDRKEVKKGFSFTYFFFGPLVPLFRGHIAGFFIAIAISVFTVGFGHIVLCFSYNKMYINYLVSNGYVIENFINIK